MCKRNSSIEGWNEILLAAADTMHNKIIDTGGWAALRRGVTEWPVSRQPIASMRWQLYYLVAAAAKQAI